MKLIEVQNVAKACHEANRVYCNSIGDDSQPIWDEAPDWQRKSAIKGVMFLMDNPDVGPDDSHISWMEEKVRDGWVYGPVKDPEKKEHPCMVAYDQLPVEQQTKDHLFQAIVQSFL